MLVRTSVSVGTQVKVHGNTRGRRSKRKKKEFGHTQPKIINVVYVNHRVQ